MSVIWLLFPIAYAADEDCLNISPNVTDEDCGNLDITMEYYDANENCTQALFNEKFESLDFAYTVLYRNSFTAIFDELKTKVWADAQDRASAKFGHKKSTRRDIFLISNETKRILNIAKVALLSKSETNALKGSDILRRQHDMLNEAMSNLTRTREALKNLGSTIGNFGELHKLYVTIRAQGNRVHLCNAELRRINANLMHRGVGGDGEQVLQDCKDLLDKNLTEKLVNMSGMFCKSPETARQRRFLSTSGVASVRMVSDLTATECIKHANYPDLESLDVDVLIGDEEQVPLFSVEDKILNECETFTEYIRAYLVWKAVELFAGNAAQIAKSVLDVNRQLSYVAEAAETCSTQTRTMYRKFKINAELLAKAQACGQKMTEQWTKDVEKCLEANKWKSVWLPWYNLYNLLGENSNCVQTHNIIVGCMVTAFATVVTFFCVISCIWSARNCSCCCFRPSKTRRSRRRKYVSDSDDTDDSSDEEHYRRKHSPKARKKKGKSDRNEKKAKKQKEDSKYYKSDKKTKKGKKSKKDRNDEKKDRKNDKKNKAESDRDDSRKVDRGNSYNPEDETKVQWWLSGEKGRSLRPVDCERGLQPRKDARIVYEQRQPQPTGQALYQPPPNTQHLYHPPPNAQHLYQPPPNAQQLYQPQPPAQVAYQPQPPVQVMYQPPPNVQQPYQSPANVHIQHEPSQKVQVVQEPAHVTHTPESQMALKGLQDTHVVPQNPQESQMVSKNSQEVLAVPKDSQESQMVSKNSQEVLVVPKDSQETPVVPKNNKETPAASEVTQVVLEVPQEAQAAPEGEEKTNAVLESVKESGQ